MFAYCFACTRYTKICLTMSAKADNEFGGCNRNTERVTNVFVYLFGRDRVFKTKSVCSAQTSNVVLLALWLGKY